ncbi:immunity 50 family protein [Salipaludibacillus sp. LMS25]|jgi:ribosomal protein L15|uniref:Imm50 family immunity protein n=1 Tax=Salipaludibacillus sp. LMS25 TaxID=2924031 RepID=UPI0020D17F82|nr:Imm50 family immunity protein [Salipaludibacillus sp. LMS25]UTR13952.1 immunity 50 family protein [Salipaludibacillus sp. LMS25]
MWYNFLERSKFISNLYDDVPDLNNVRIAAIKITDEGRRVSIHFNMPKFGDNPPSKWNNSRYNTVFVELDFFDIKDLSVSYCKENLRGNINIQKNEESGLKVSISGSVNVTFLADIGMIQSVSGYIDTVEE